MKLARSIFVAMVLFAVAAPLASAGEGNPTGTAPDAASITSKTLSIGTVMMDFEFVPKGTFDMGSPMTEKDRNPDETQHTVTISHDLWVARTPVTFAQYQAFVSATGHQTEAEKGTSGGFGVENGTLIQNKKYTWKTPGYATDSDLPVTLVTYDDATFFADWASNQAHVQLRLPTEAEYERAERGDSTSAFYSKDGDPLTTGWFGTNSNNHSHAVATRAANKFGLYDMSGNVWEWCGDVYGPYAVGGVTDPLGTTPPSGEPMRRVLRGGSFLKDPKNGRSAARYRNTPGSRNADNGFRLVFDPAVTLATPSGTGPAPSVSVQIQHDADPPGVRTRTGGSGALLGIPLGLGCFGGFMALLVWLLTRAASGGRGIAPNVTTRVAQDGFFIVAPGVAPGARVRYECVVRGVPITDVVPISGPETFVYTGGLPEVIRILDVVSLAGSSYRGVAAPYEMFGNQRRSGGGGVPMPHAQRPRPVAGPPRAY